MIYPRVPPTGQIRLNLDAPLADGLVLWLPLMSHSITDLARGLVFAKSGTAPVPTTDLMGPTWDFTSASSTYLVTMTTPVAALPLTIAAWFNPSAVATTRDIVSIADSANTTDAYNLQQRASAGVGARAADTGGPVAAISSKVVVANTWQLGVATFASTTLRTAYIDGRNPGTSSTSKTPTGLDQVGVGADVNSSVVTPFDGSISNVCIWNRALSAAEVWQLFDPLTRWQLYDTRRIFAAALTAFSFFISDAGSGSEATSLGAAFTATDSGAGSDAPGGAAALTLPDVAGGADVLAQLLAAFTRTETGAGSDVIGSLGAAFTATDSGTGSDAPGNAGNALSGADSGTGSDVLSQVAALLATLDSGVGSDAPGNASNALNVTDSGSGTEAQTITVAFALTDSGSGAETLAKALLLAVADSGAGLDALSSVTAAFTLADAGAGGEAQTVMVTLSVADVGSALEALTVLTATLVNIFETGVGSDLLVAPAVQLSVADAGSALEARTVTVQLTLAESGAGVEALVANVAAALTDSGLGGEQLAIAVAIGLSETGHGVDAASVPSYLLAIAEAGAGSDAIGSATVSFALADTGHLAETLSQIAVALALLEQMHGVEVVATLVSTVKLVKVTFAFLRRTVRYLWRTRRVGFALAPRRVEFSFLANELG